RLGGDAPVRVELDLGPVPAEPAAAARALARSLAQARGLACEGLLVDCLDPEGGPRLEAFAKALLAVGLDLPLAPRVEARFAGVAGGGARRRVGRAGGVGRDAGPAGAAATAPRRGRPLEGERRAGAAGVAALVDRCLAAGEAAGLAEPLFSVDAEHPVAAA